MLARERQAAITELVKINNIVLIGQIAKEFGVSLETARRDLEALQDQGVVKRIHGGAILSDMSTVAAPSQPTPSSYSGKKAIGIQAASLIKEGETIFLDTGTTTLEVAHHLKSMRELTVITNSITIINELINTNIKVIVLGGTLKNDEQMIYSYATEQMFSQYFVDKAFFSCGGVSDNGVTDYGETLDRYNIARHSKNTILLADSGKFGRTAKIKACDLDVVDILIVDDNIDRKYVDKLKKKKVQVILAPIASRPEEEADN